ncbi:SDR family NAD(P)-dependent oxidoreductase [Piscibacillus salipiscarius]|uniref:SDR family NAD(P)-dependent oxidoreductase n=1 Tax=Piscibacillus salipiscarius TaxID=299480 RepID=A0ABW5QEE3_9BACI|nr:glucose 1-dehydrogenase [Piscibacillus salipiscarius]
MRFGNKVAVITGAGSGIGAAVAKRLAKEGAKVVLVGRTKQKLDRVSNEIVKENGLSYVYPTDVTDDQAVNQLKDYIQSEFGQLDILVNNAGSSGKSSIRDLTSEEWQRVQDVNLKSVFLVSKTLSELMLEGLKRDRSIVNVASLSGHKAGARIPHYSASKAAVINFSKALAAELAPHVRVNSVSPGFIETPLTEAGLQNERFQSAIEQHTALGRVGKPDEIANIITFLSSSEASYMTGSDVLADGGWLIT